MKDIFKVCICQLSGSYEQQNFTETVYSALTELCESLNISKFIFAYSFTESLMAPKHEVITNANDWMKHYAASNLRSNDPIVNYLLSSNKPICWQDLYDIPEYNAKEQLDVLAQASEFGLRYGVSMPSRTAKCLSVLSFSDDKKDMLRHSGDLMIYGSVLSTHLVDQACILERSAETKPDPTEVLTGREISCLQWACEGKTAWEIGQILSITERTVVFHLTNAVTKLNASSRQHAISKAILLGILQPQF